MDNETRTYIEARVNELIAAPSCCAEARAAGRAWLDAKGTDGEGKATEALIAELKEDITPIDGLIAFAGSPAGQGVFGDAAETVLANARARKQAGELYCDCAACAACEAILRKLKVIA